LISQPFRGEGRVFYLINKTPTFSPKKLGSFIFSTAERAEIAESLNIQKSRVNKSFNEIF